MDLEALQDGLKPVQIVYTNRDGRTTARSIVPFEFYESCGHQYVRAYCYLRHEHRTFALRRLVICGGGEDSDGADTFALRRLVLCDGEKMPVREAAIFALRQPVIDHGAEDTEEEDSLVPRCPAPDPDSPQSTSGSGGKSVGWAGSAEGNSGGASDFFSACFGFLFQCIFYGAAILLFLASPFGELFVDFDYGSFDDTPSANWVFDFDSGKAGSSGAGSNSSGAGSGESNGAPRNWTYRGFELRRGSDGHVYAPSLGWSFSSGRDAHFTINAQAFQSETGLYDRTLMQIYMNADSDRNGHLSWREVAEFQRKTYRSFEYRYNSTALDPAEFLRQGGGDCEDFALFTCGMLRFWGWNCKVAGFYPPGGGCGHAIAMVWSAAPINGYGYIRIPEGCMVGSTYMQAGCWIPIDYDSIGDFSSAMGDDWELWDLDDPEDLYGAYL